MGLPYRYLSKPLRPTQPGHPSVGRCNASRRWFRPSLGRNGASEVTTLWRFVNQFNIILLLYFIELYRFTTALSFYRKNLQVPYQSCRFMITFSEVAGRRLLRSASRRHLTMLRYRLSTFGRRAFSVAGPTSWNSIPDRLHDSTLCSDSFRGNCLKRGIICELLNTLSTVKMLHDSALCKFAIDWSRIDQSIDWLTLTLTLAGLFFVAVRACFTANTVADLGFLEGRWLWEPDENWGGMGLRENFCALVN